MYSSKENVNILTSLLLKGGITKAVVCPGSRNSPIVHNLCACPGIACYPVTDERSAAFVALGMTLAENEPVAVCVTSGSALLNTAPAVAEACYQNRPLIILSADRPAQWIDQQDGQTIHQQGALAPHVRKSVTLPEPHDDEERWYCNRLVNEALDACMLEGGGPVHINVPVSEPLSGYGTLQLPDERRILLHRSVADAARVSDMAADFFCGEKPMIVLGQMIPEVVGESLEDIEALRRVAVVLQEKLADDDLRPAQPIDEVLESIGDDTSYRPDHLIYIGGTVVSKRLRHFLRKCACRMSVTVNERGDCCDTFMHATDILQGAPEEVLALLAREAKGVERKAFTDRWERAFDRAAAVRRNFRPDYSQLAAVKAFHEKMQAEDIDGELFYANSSAVRLGNIFSNQYLYVNRGVNGIEGTLSTAVGYALARQDEEDVYCVIGDLSFFYDQNALWNEQLPPNLSILLLNNGGGGIFRQLPGLERSPYRDSAIAAGHTASAEGICQAYGLVYLSARNGQELSRALDSFFHAEEGPVLLEVFTRPEADARVLKDYYQSF
ncbi:2-succinyl-5-enolpyruvyl-6-hydroxy-3-cyclohexene-1-carboxylic-acid synthase [Prevotella multiformis]|uniref:2-succinyl-5-enolpyruvyl-6-hydroxy-3-cyclohexene-1-carboxylate synthase n=1 Tax=Prevotella multiformis DSM 16608 TaxID=888743 RepID=F0F9H2_9BACT|nr:2-succinyl-5-enolpyruvyl-6-hydroxy-3-cyclohexene-1-carboxylic-acid synthase [Prevotella multiformis]EGC19200.1 2-succinyl-5-enolpyruvyl-6-hydroxy-3-cyclohexene-1-carboxylic-acid synthase [Prevotella multiformis DSM 16608]